MEVYLVGLSKNMRTTDMEVYLAGTRSRTFVFGEKMRLYLAGELSIKNGKNADWHGLNILESYFYLRNNKEFPRLVKDFSSFLLDSGAFTFMSQSNANIDWDEYIRDYGNFINRWGIDLFFELDIDSVVGLTETEKLRKKLESITGKKPIPVWHKSRGIEYFKKMCSVYPYVALGGIVTKEIPVKHYEKMFPWFINYAHRNGCRIHALGYTNVKGLHKFKFDSVDSTAWIYGNIGGHVYQFNAQNGEMNQVKVPQGARLKSSEVAKHNFNEWVRFQQYARTYL